MEKVKKKTWTSWIAISNSWKENKMVEDLEKKIKPAPNQKLLGRKKKSGSTSNYKTKQGRKTDWPNKIWRGFYRLEYNGSARIKMDKNSQQKQQK